MITEDYVSFETANLMKEKGFNWNTDKQFNLDKIVGDYNITDRSRHPERYLDAPTLQMAMKWLREKHNLGVFPSWSQVFGLYGCRMYYLKKGSQEFYSVGVRYNTYEEACEAAIKYCLENLI